MFTASLFPLRCLETKIPPAGMSAKARYATNYEVAAMLSFRYAAAEVWICLKDVCWPQLWQD